MPLLPVVTTWISMRRDRTWRKPLTVFADASQSHAAAQLRGNDGAAERRRKQAISSWISSK